MTDHHPAHVTQRDNHPAISDRHRRFVEEYTLDYNAAAAARRVGYTETRARQTGHEILQRPEVQAALAERERRLADQLGITEHYLLERTREVVDTALTPTPQTYQGRVIRVLDDDGNLVELTETQGSVATKALELLMRARGMLTDRVEHSGGVGVQFIVEGVPDEDLP